MRTIRISFNQNIFEEKIKYLNKKLKDSPAAGYCCVTVRLCVRMCDCKTLDVVAAYGQCSH